MDLLLCLLLGHTWQPTLGRAVWRCPHCERRATDLEVLAYADRKGLDTVSALFAGPPKRALRHTH